MLRLRKTIDRRSFNDYRTLIKDQYDGLPGALTAVTGIVTGHEALAGWLIRPGNFDVRDCTCILDAACGNGRYSSFLLKHAPAQARITAFDYSQNMIRRARKRPDARRVTHVAADITRLPYADEAFDAVVCGWVIEHLDDPRPALRQLARVMKPGGKMLLLTTENTVSGAVCSRLWNCRTYARRELRAWAEESGLDWHRERWFTKVHQALRMGGIIVELRKSKSTIA